MTTSPREALIDDIRQRTGLDEARIARVVHAFYGRVRRDALLAPIFAERIDPPDWPAHLDRMVAFWSAVALMSGAYHGRPVQRHLNLRLADAHFDRWLELFRATAREVGPPEGAAHLIAAAERIARNMRIALDRLADG